MSNESRISMKRQKPTRFPYSCQAQLGMSGIGAPPAGGVSTVRGMVWLMSHSSTFTMVQTTMRALPGSCSARRWLMGEYAIRSSGFIDK
jgi:hypothetical protein